MAGHGHMPDWPGVPLNVPRTGWGKISDTQYADDGKYRITEYVHDADSGDWVEAAHPPGYEDHDAHEIHGGTSGKEGELVQWWEASLMDGTLVLLFQQRGGLVLWGKATQNWVKVAGNGSYVPCNPCDDKDGSGVDTGTTVNVYLPRCGGPQDPNVVEDAVIPYLVDRNGDAVCVGEYLDGTIDKSVQIWRGDPGDLAADKPGWQRETNWDDRPFLAVYDPDDDEYNCTADTGGFKWHGQSENNHSNHCLSHTHCLSAPLCGYDIGNPASWILPSHSGDSGGADWSDSDYNKHDGPYNNGSDTDNRPPYKVVLLIKRVDNSAPAP